MSEVKRPMKRYKVWKEDGPVGWSAVTDAEPGDILILASCFDDQAENAELTERWLTRSSEVDQLKTRCSEYQRKVAGMVQRQDYEDRCDRIAELEAALRKIKALHHCMATRVLDVIAIIDAALEDTHE
jgi:hypothetical protein